MSGAESSSSGGGRYVVAIDFGTTFSGFAFLQTSDPERRIFKFYKWEDSQNAGGSEYCKTKTALYYESDAANGTYQLVAWGWSAVEACTEALELLQSSNASSSYSSTPEFCSGGVTTFQLAAQGGRDPRFGCYVEQFKLDVLQERPASHRLRLPGDLTIERLIVDYLKKMGDQVMKELREKYSNNLDKNAVEWCLTVPSIWDERAKQVMKVCAEKAGLVQGDQCPTPADASPHPLDIILEPEGASMYCQQQAKAELHLRKGDKLLIADVGGGTIDLVVHIKSEDDPNNTEVEEVVSSYGELGGGTFVDEAFFNLLSEKIGCFDSFCRNDPAARLRINKKWQGMKTGFHGGRHSNSLPIYGKLKKAWKEYDSSHGQLKDEDDDDYSHIMLKEQDFRRIFDSQVDKVLELISKHVKGVKVLMVVGGFATSAYLRKRVEEKFRGAVSQIVVPPEPGSAICYGAVQLHLKPANIQARIQRRTYGLEMARSWEKDDPQSLMIRPDGIFGAKLCSKAFDVFVRAGDRVPRNEFMVRTYVPVHPKQKGMQLNLYSTERTYPKFINEEGCKQEGGFHINMEKGMKLGRKREVEVTMVFGASSLQISAVGKNFGDGSRVQHSFPITFM